jgi:hypothetical protein
MEIKREKKTESVRILFIKISCFLKEEHTFNFN